MRYLSVCSGIEAASVAWGHLGWTPVAFAEIEPFPCAVLAHHYPSVPNLGDMTAIDGAAYRGQVDVLVGGTPCQSFSVAGLRRGLADERGNLALKFVELADAVQPSFVVWENVPGVLSTKDNAFGCFLGGLSGFNGELLPPRTKREGRIRWTGAGCVFGPQRTVAWRILDAQYFGVPQRRRRLFVVACPRNGADPLSVLFEFDGVRRDTPPRREEKEGLTSPLARCPSRCSATGRPQGVAGNLFSPQSARCPQSSGNVSHWQGAPHPTLSQSGKRAGGIGMSDQEIFSQGGAGLVWSPSIVGQAMSCKWSKGTSGPAGDEHHNLVCVKAPEIISQYGDIAGSLTRRHDSSPGADRGMTIIASHDSSFPHASGSITRPHDRECKPESCIAIHPHCIGRAPSSGPQGKEYLTNGSAYTMDTRGAQAVAFAQNQLGEIRTSDVCGTLNRNSHASGRNAPLLFTPAEGRPPIPQRAKSFGSLGVRRLTPRECERLQGVPDDYTAITYRGKPAADAPRYRALGNSFAVPVIEWIGRRIEKYGLPKRDR